MKYRVVINVGYCEAWFDYEDPQQAICFAMSALEHGVENEDTNKKTKIILYVIKEGENDKAENS